MIDNLRSRIVRTAAYRRLSTRASGPLTPTRAAARLSAYVYGNILVLTAVVAASPASIDDGDAFLLVLATASTTFVAHVFAETVARSNIPESVHGSTDNEKKQTVIDEIRDAVPIASSGTVPAVILALAWLWILPTFWAQLIAGGVVVFRIATLQIVAQRLRGQPLTFKVFVAGLVTAALAAVIVFLKVYTSH
ncbi:MULTISPECIES: hypothetical protein [Nocardiaceae]|jgi:hypothetical protein|uniref:hypothetical protein n=1 Tax=Nocardiaceae TaxID=85025 RepID=UPI000561D3AD|nr:MULTISPECIES: hypothetical protein [Rhodococcus]OZF04748.1 hypothetical protein CH301_04800 [Rhodococcus sp. 15-1189-1-1a]OZF19013.1 hypothetical protein CH299_05345 [Rhodococcus sp. 14-2686-1-2]OZF55736.1 hypothetical protein CH293_05225 [Rhodococcus sp. 14-2470-1b]